MTKNPKENNKINKLNFNLKNEIFSFLALREVLIHIFPVSRNFAFAVKESKSYQLVKDLLSQPKVINKHLFAVKCILHLEDNLIASCSNDSTIRIFNILTTDCILTIVDSNPICALEKLNENELAAGDESAQIKIWNFRNGSFIKALVGHTDWITQILKIDDDKILSCGFDSKIKLWDINSGEILLTYDEHVNAVCTLVILNDNEFLSASRDKKIKLWQLKDNSNDTKNSKENKSLKTFTGHTCWVNSIIKIDQKVFWTGGWDGTIRKWNVNLSECIKVINCSYSINSLLQVNECEIIVGALYSIGFVKTFNTSTGELVKTYKEHGDTVNRLIHISKFILLSCSNDGLIMIQKI